MPTCEIVFSGIRGGKLGVVRREDGCTVSGAFLWREVEIIKFKGDKINPTGLLYGSGEIRLTIEYFSL